MSSPPRFFIAARDFSSLLPSSDGTPERVERGSLLTLTGNPLSNSSRKDSALHHSETLWLKVHESKKLVGVRLESVHEIEQLIWSMLLAVTDTEERLVFYREHNRLKEVMNLSTGDYVRVQVISSSGRKERGVLRYKGSVNHKKKFFLECSYWDLQRERASLMAHSVDAGFSAVMRIAESLFQEVGWSGIGEITKFGNRVTWMTSLQESKMN